MVARCIFVQILLFVFIQASLAQQEDALSTVNVYIDDNGVMRWTQSKEEVKGFGVNYTVPFAHAYRSAKKLGVDPLRAIDQDVYHFARLGFDLYRVHVWDTEISDTLGNLLYNEHFHAFDYLLKKLGERNINYILTPIAFWGNGWPEPDEATPGFSAKYGKGPSLTEPGAIRAQERYLTRFMNHVNPYTGIAYKDDPRLLAVEISNEPHHREDPAEVTAFIRRMVEAVRKSGCKKPVFYNVSHSVHLAGDYFTAGIQGGTFQWYPTGLGYQRELPGNFLPNVDEYPIPFNQTIKAANGVKIVYEFDAADIGRSYIYPAMARSFREAGIQLATHFAYDPMYLAYANTEYNTHHMNLAFTPQKALSLMICSEIFHSIPMNKDYGSYPSNTSFEGFKVSYEKDLATCNRDGKYFYTNSTTEPPANESGLSKIAGYGTSPVLQYNGTGAYFLDRLEPGVWRLEVMPDAQIVANPYGRNSLEKKVAVVQWNERRMQIDLEDLGNSFNLSPLNEGNRYQPVVENGTFRIRPGAYLVVRQGLSTEWDAGDTWDNSRLSEFQAPGDMVDSTYFVHEPPTSAIEGKPLTIRARIIAPGTSPSLRLVANYGAGGETLDMQHVNAYTYEVTIPGEKLSPGFLTYYLVIDQEGNHTTFPAGLQGFPYDWDFYARQPYRVNILQQDQPLYLFNAIEDWQDLSFRRWPRGSKLVPTGQANEAEYQVNIEELHRPDNENRNGPVINDFTVRYYVKDKLEHLSGHLQDKNKLVIKVRSLDRGSTALQVALVTKDGSSFGKIIEIDPAMKTYEIPFEELKKVKTVLMPRPYPTFLPYYFSTENNTGLQAGDLEGIQLSIGPGLSTLQQQKSYRIGIVSIAIR